MDTELPKKILAKAAISMVPDNQSKTSDGLLKDGSINTELYGKVTKQIEQISELITNVRQSSTIINWEAFDHLPYAEERKQRIISALEGAKYNISLREDDEVKVTVLDGKSISRSIVAPKEGGEILEMGLEVVESIIVFLEFIGISVPYDEKKMQKAIQKAIAAVRKSRTLIDDVHKLHLESERWYRRDMVREMLFLVFYTFNEGLLWDIVTALLSLAPSDELITFVKIAASILVILTADSTADIASLLAFHAKGFRFEEKEDQHNMMLRRLSAKASGCSDPGNEFQDSRTDKSRELCIIDKTKHNDRFCYLGFDMFNGLIKRPILNTIKSKEVELYENVIYTFQQGSPLTSWPRRYEDISVEKVTEIKRLTNDELYEQLLPAAQTSVDEMFKPVQLDNQYSHTVGILKCQGSDITISGNKENRKITLKVEGSKEYELSCKGLDESEPPFIPQIQPKAPAIIILELDRPREGIVNKEFKRENCDILVRHILQK